LRREIVWVIFAGRNPWHIDRPRAERLVQVGAAEWLGKRKIRFITDPPRRGVSPFPEFHEAVGDASHGVGIANCNPRMTEDKHDFLHALRRISA